MTTICMVVGKRILGAMESMYWLFGCGFPFSFQPYEDCMSSVGAELPLPSESYFQISFTSCLLGLGDWSATLGSNVIPLIAISWIQNFRLSRFHNLQPPSPMTDHPSNRPGWPSCTNVSPSSQVAKPPQTGQTPFSKPTSNLDTRHCSRRTSIF